MKKLSKEQQRHRRHGRVRARLSGTAERPRLHVYRSLRGMYAQLIDDVNGKTLVGLHTKKITVSKTDDTRSRAVALAYALGQALAAQAKEHRITKVVFDRAGYQYHGRVKAVADGARDGGLEF